MKMAAKIENKKITLSKERKDGVYVYKKMTPVFWATRSILITVLAGHSNTPVCMRKDLPLKHISWGVNKL